MDVGRLSWSVFVDMWGSDMGRGRGSARKAGAGMESVVVKYLVWALDDSGVERRHPTGAKGGGDVTGVMLDRGRVVIECRSTARMDVSGHVGEAQAEAGNDGAVYWAVVQRRRGIGLWGCETVGRQLVYMTLEQCALLLNHGQRLGPDAEAASMDGLQASALLAAAVLLAWVGGRLRRPEPRRRTRMVLRVQSERKGGA